MLPACAARQTSGISLAGPAELALAVTPRLRGVLHAAAFPLAVAAGIVLICLAPQGAGRLSAAIYAASAWSVFGISATYHLGRWSGRWHAVLRRLDHASIYLLIAGTYTPFALLALGGDARTAVMWAVWGGASVGVLAAVLCAHGPRWISTSLCILLGWVAAFVMPELLRGAGVAAVVLAIVGGGLYSLGGLVYATRRPDPAPRVFGFHEVFHALTIAAFATQYVAVSLVVYLAS
jgi:hemolysin III